MNQSPLLANSPIDGRYANATDELRNYFSEYALIKYRLQVEIEYFIFLAEKRFFKLDKKQVTQLRGIMEAFSPEEAEGIKSTEKVTNHDVKAVEYYLKQKLTDMGL
ncbi:MAG: adenylosuccinate lyase, partial [Bacteroidota bacterium]